MSSTLEKQQRLFSTLDRNIIVENINGTIVASNITSANFANIKIVINNPMFADASIYLNDVHVFINNNLKPTYVPGLLQILQSRIRDSDTDGYLATSTASTHQPFLNGFVLNNAGTASLTTPQTSIDKVVSNLATHNSDIPLITVGTTPILYTLVFNSLAKK
jgi:hypothetical protein